MTSIYCGSYRFVKFHSLDNDTLFCKGTTKFADLQILRGKSFHQLSIIRQENERNCALIVRVLSVYCA